MNVGDPKLVKLVFKYKFLEFSSKCREFAKWLFSSKFILVLFVSCCDRVLAKTLYPLLALSVLQKLHCSDKGPSLAELACFSVAILLYSTLKAIVSKYRNIKTSI